MSIFSARVARAQYVPIPNFTGTNAGQQFRNALNNKLSGADTAAPQLVHLNFYQLPATVTNGQMFYLNDGTPGIPCAGGGTGALAMGVNGQWLCKGATGTLNALTVNGSTALNAGLAQKGSTTISALPDPAAPIVIVNTTGVTSYTYFLVGHDGSAGCGSGNEGVSKPSAGTIITNGAATPNNTVSIPTTSGYVAWDVLKTATTTSLATCLAPGSSVVDTGQATAAYTPLRNTTADVRSANVNGVINVATYGVICDGVLHTGNKANLQAALNAAAAALKGYVILPSFADCVMDAAGLNLDVSHAGIQGNGSVLDFGTITTGNYLALTATDATGTGPYQQGVRYALSDLRIVGSGKTNTATGINFSVGTVSQFAPNVSQLALSNVTVDDVGTGENFANNTYLIAQYNTRIWSTTTPIQVAASNLNGGENLSWHGGALFNSSGVINCLGVADMYFYSVSWDGNTQPLVTGGGTCAVNLFGVHIEETVADTVNQMVVLSGNAFSQFKMYGGAIQNDIAGANEPSTGIFNMPAGTIVALFGVLLNQLIPALSGTAIATGPNATNIVFWGNQPVNGTPGNWATSILGSSVTTYTANATLPSQIVVARCNSTANITLTLPTDGLTSLGQIIDIKNINTGHCNLIAGTNPIDGVTTGFNMSPQYESVRLRCTAVSAGVCTSWDIQ